MSVRRREEEPGRGEGTQRRPGAGARREATSRASMTWGQLATRGDEDRVVTCMRLRNSTDGGWHAPGE